MVVFFDLIAIVAGLCIIVGSLLQAWDALGEYKVKVEGLPDDGHITLTGIRFIAGVIFSGHGRWTKGGEWNDNPLDETTRYLRTAQGWILIVMGSCLVLLAPIYDLYMRWNSWALKFFAIHPWVLYATVTPIVWLWLSIRMKRKNNPTRKALLLAVMQALLYAVIWPIWLFQVLISLPWGQKPK